MSIEDLWYKNAIIYCLDVDKYMDANGDGVGSDHRHVDGRTHHVARNRG